MKRIAIISACLVLMTFLLLSAEGEELAVPVYADYLSAHAGAAHPDQEIIIFAADHGDLHDSGAYVETQETQGVSEALIWASGISQVDFPFTVEEEGLYQLKLTYLPLPARQLDLEFSVLVDGVLPFDKAASVLLYRMYAPVGSIGQNSRGNDVRPKLKEVSAWQTAALQDSKSHYAEPYEFFLTQGEHTLSLAMTAESMAISRLIFCNSSMQLSYADYQSGHPMAETPQKEIVIQGEAAAFTSSQTLYPLSERASAATQPADPVKVRMNTIGGENWKQQGQWLEWCFSAEESGWYNLSMRVLQEYARGISAMRCLTIDGTSPFDTAASFAIPYRLDWQMYTLGGCENPQSIYLEQGEHVMRLSIPGSQTSDSLRQLLNVVSEMSALYRQIIIITGANADADRVTIDLNRDFQLEKKIPGFTGRLQAIAAALREEEAEIAGFAGSGSEAALLLQVAAQMESFAKKPETIPGRLENFKGNISSLSSWALRMADQPLQLDYIVFSPVNQPLPEGGVSFLEQAAFRWNAFIGSFHENYNAVGEIYEEADSRDPLTVWVCSNDLGATGIASGRDQTQLIKELIDQDFVPQTGVPVNLSLIDGSSTLMQAILGGKGPDVALTVYKELPVNLAMRGALVDLSKFEGFDEVAARFYPSALVPYRYQGGIYGLPETQNFYMIFYRTDMFQELGLTVPETWDDMRALIPLLSKNGMRVGIPEPTVTNNNTLGFQIHLFQRGLNYYTEDLEKTNFDQPEALEAFTKWTDLYTKYSLPVKYDFFSRFRTGEMPIALDSYTMANTLAAAAPELDGLWSIAPIPGICQADGSIDRSEGAMGTSAVIIAASQNQADAFRFISWWTSDETQTTFGLSLENLMGAAARWPTANKNAFLSMRWPRAQQQAILTQWAYVNDIPQLPGNYIINRNLSFAFRAVVYDNKIPREVLAKYNKEINKEIQRKWAEFSTTEGAGQ